MIHQPEYLKMLMKKHMELRASPSEIEILRVALDLYDEEEIVRMLDEIDPEIPTEECRHPDWGPPPYQELIDRINRKSSWKIRPLFKPKFVRAAINAGTIVLAALLAWFFRGSSKLLYSCEGLPGDSEIPTGVYSCSLILASGCRIMIDSTYKGRVTWQGNTEITKLPSGTLLYKKADADVVNDTTRGMYNSIITSAGDQYQVILPDGSRIRLNAASCIRFPVAFSATERVVTLQGEAFFDVAPNKAAPFYVNAGNTEIEALGTSFNINAYSESTIATLLSGSLEVKNYGDSVRLKPGQEAVAGSGPTTNSRLMIAVHPADTAKSVSWKKVMRVYKNVPIKTFVSDIGRWYDLEMLHTGCIPARLISATLCYETPMSEILKLFRENGLSFIQAGRKIVFCPGHKK